VAALIGPSLEQSSSSFIDRMLAFTAYFLLVFGPILFMQVRRVLLARQMQKLLKQKLALVESARHDVDLYENMRRRGVTLTHLLKDVDSKLDRAAEIDEITSDYLNLPVMEWVKARRKQREERKL
jgi:hypothetical protein